MSLFFSILFIMLGLLGILSSLAVVYKNKNLFSLPILAKPVSVLDKLRYQFFTQSLTGILFLTYGFLILSTDIIAWYLYIIIALVTLIVISLIGHLKFLLL